MTPKHYLDSVKDMIDSASLACGGVFAGYIGVKVGGESGLDYLNLTAVFVAAIMFVSCLNGLSNFLVRRITPGIWFSLMGLFASIFIIFENAPHVGIDRGVLFCVFVAWSIVPLAAWGWGRAASKEIGND